MILVDASGWVDYFRGRVTAQTDLVEGLLDSQELAIGDLNFIEVLQGCKVEREFNEVRRHLGRLDIVPLGGEDIVVTDATLPLGHQSVHCSSQQLLDGPGVPE